MKKMGQFWDENENFPQVPWGIIYLDSVHDGPWNNVFFPPREIVVEISFDSALTWIPKNGKVEGISLNSIPQHSTAQGDKPLLFEGF